MEVDLLKYSHTSHERANIVNLFQWHDGQHFCETDKEGIFTCEWSYCVLHVCWESFDIFIESGLFRLGGAQISGGKKYEARTLPFKVYMVKLLAEHCGKGKRWVYVAWYVHATLWKIPMVGWDLHLLSSGFYTLKVTWSTCNTEPEQITIPSSFLPFITVTIYLTWSQILGKSCQYFRMGKNTNYPNIISINYYLRYQWFRKTIWGKRLGYWSTITCYMDSRKTIGLPQMTWTGG